MELRFGENHTDLLFSDGLGELCEVLRRRVDARDFFDNADELKVIPSAEVREGIMEGDDLAVGQTFERGTDLCIELV